MNINTSTLSEMDRLSLYERKKKGKTAAYLLFLFLGGFGGHRLYLGRAWTGALYVVLTMVSFAIPAVAVLVAAWWIVDVFLIPGMVRRHNEGVIRWLGGS